MRLSVVSALCLLGAVSALYDDSMFVQTITAANFDHRITDNKDLWVLQFFKPDEKASKKFVEEWE
jgi:hypothetical protein